MKMFQFRAYMVLVIAIMLFACKKDESNQKFPLAKEHNIDVTALVSAFNKMQSVEGIASLVVCRDGVIVAEKF